MCSAPGGQGRPPLQTVFDDGGQAAFYGYATKMLPTCFGGKDPPAFTYASAPELLFHPYTAANTSGS